MYDVKKLGLGFRKKKSEAEIDERLMEMGEASPCLMRSVSQPFFASCEYKEGDPLRALTTSISFGRFMTEPLDWERWSTFSHNRTLEDVQKHSRPGVVAEKKAFFEAHYKKIAAKKATKSPKKENKAPNYSPKTNPTSPIKNSDPKRSNSHPDIDDTGGNQSPTLVTNTVLSCTNEHMPSNRHVEQEIASFEDVPLPSTNQVFPQFGNVDDNVPSAIGVEQEKGSIENVSSPSTNKVLSQFCDLDDNVPSGSQVLQEKGSIENVSSPIANEGFSQFRDFDDNASSGSQVEQEKTSIENVPSPSTNQVFPQFGIVDDSMPGGSQVEQEKASIENVSSHSTNKVFSQFRDLDNNMPSGSQVEQENALIKNIPSPTSNQVLPQSSNVSDNVPGGSHVEQEKASNENVFVSSNKDAASGNKDKVVSGQTKKPEISSSKNGAHKLRSPRKALIPPICRKKAATDVTEKKRSAPKALHMSMNFPPVRKIIGLCSSPWAHKNGTSKGICKPKDRLTQQDLTGVSVNGVKKSSKVLSRPEIRRSKPLLDCSVNGRRTVDMKPLSTNHSEASSGCTKKPKSSTVPTSFRLRSEERAAKRKEASLDFFQKLEEKSNTKEMGTIQLQPKLKRLSEGSSELYIHIYSDFAQGIHVLVQEKARNDKKRLQCAPAVEAKAPTNSMQKEKARNDNKEISCDPALEAKPSTSEKKVPSNSMQKEKARNENKELSCTPAVEAKAKPSTNEKKVPSNSMQKEKARNEAKPSISEKNAPSDSMQKVLPTRPCSPKLGRKPTPRLVLDRCYPLPSPSPSPWRSSSKPKNFIEINKKILSSSMASLPTKKMYDSTLMSKK
ncbi:hypothetical protein OSB04_009057 [Centaurea solstitialis]|uniref:TPX2 C-terminal domain-containing protein n=1 Tax=Centaurea solstitialis TaxID=347529 RepID=A0AA38WK09_9ASTR|nr:hypothetical protein OSB04_009057 [Centaurea solstitialis]